MPPVLTLCLYRFELDYETWQRKKLDDKFEYPLELDMSKYLSDEAKTLYPNQDDTMYELKSIIIHRGGAYGGHYLAYIKDDSKEGNWYLQKDIEIDNNPSEIKRKKFDPKDHMSEQQLKELEEEQNNKKKDKKKKDKNKEKEVVELDYSRCDYPLPYSSPELLERWFEFNDSAVVPIYSGTLQSKFGGNTSNGSAYMLVYRQRALSKNAQSP